MRQIHRSKPSCQSHLCSCSCKKIQAIRHSYSLSNPAVSIMHTEVDQKLQPTPKVTETWPNIVNVDFFTPQRHHLDDTEIKKIFYYPLYTNCNEVENEYHIQTGPPNNRNRNSCKMTELSQPNAGLSTRNCYTKPLGSSRSEIINLKYVCDGRRVVYRPPVRDSEQNFMFLQQKQKQFRKPEKNPKHIVNRHQRKEQKDLQPNGFEVKRVRVGDQKVEDNRERAAKSPKFMSNKVSIRDRKAPNEAGNCFKLIQNMKRDLKNNREPNYTQKTLLKDRYRLTGRNVKVQPGSQRFRIKDPFTSFDQVSHTDQEFSEIQM